MSAIPYCKSSRFSRGVRVVFFSMSSEVGKKEKEFISTQASGNHCLPTLIKEKEELLRYFMPILQMPDDSA